MAAGSRKQSGTGSYSLKAVLDEEGIKNNLVSDIRARYKDTKATWKAARMTELYK